VSIRAPQNTQKIPLKESACPQFAHVRSPPAAVGVGEGPTAGARSIEAGGVITPAAVECPAGLADFNGAPQKMQNAMSVLLASPQLGQVRDAVIPQV
jgi:hypothetical protein